MSANGTVNCPSCAEPVGKADNFCHACGAALIDGNPAAAETTRALVPDQVRNESSAMALLPAVQADLAPLAPAIRSVAAVLATAALTDWAARYAAPMLARKTRAMVQGKRQPATQLMMIEQQVTVRRWVSVRS